MHKASHTTDPESRTCQCLARSVVQALDDEPTLEAVTIDREKQTISVATLGRTDVPRIAERLSHSYEEACAVEATHECTLLSGKGDCTACDLPLNQESLRRLTFAHSGNQTTIARVTCPTAPKFWRWRSLPLPKFVQRDIELSEAEEHLGEWKWQLLCAMLCAAFGLVAYYLTPHGVKPTVVGYVFYALAYLAGSWFAAEELWERLRKEGGLDVHFLMLAVAAGAAAVNQWNEGVVLLFLFSFAGALEHYAMERTQREIRSLFHDAPKVAVRVDERGNETEIAVEKIRSGMRLVVKPGSQFPVDAEIVKGATAADESNLTGEATPVEKVRGDTALAGTMNLWGAVEVTVLRPASESSLQKIIKLIHEAQRRKAPAQRFTDKFSATYTYVVIGVSFAMFFVWWLGFKMAPFTPADPAQPAASAFYRTMTLLVVSSPCALVLSIPSAVLAAIAWGARHGVLFRGGAAVEKLAEINTVCLDKTGTLTTGELRVEKVESIPAGREAEIPLEFAHFESVTGHGLVAQHDGVTCRLGKREWVNEDVPDQASKFPEHADHGVSEIWLAAGDLRGRVLLRDDIRPQSRQVVDALRAAGLRSVVLTGDRQSAAEHLRASLHLDDVRAGLKPEGKVEAIRTLSAAGSKVAMVGDGVNDAPSLAASHVGVAMGARGSDAALEQADVVLMHDRLENFLAAFRLSVRARRIIRQNLIISLGTVGVLVTFALLGKIPLTLGVIGHEGSTVVVVMNSLRLLLGKSAPVASAPQND
ncbi:MAG: cation-translocating P-type ATPase [Verrucomicrobia bacterium]|nr:cation-translocating P-type ATPase [Verrucomicrobiota bacterium]